LILGFSFWFLIRTLLKQKTLEEMKSDFTNNITHELKTPIAVAYAANDALLNFGQADEKAKRDKYLSISQVHQHEGTAAVGAGHVGKLPDIPEADGRTGSYQNEGPAAGPMGASARGRTHEISCRCHPPVWTGAAKCGRF
jgi:hypothetical protein